MSDETKEGVFTLPAAYALEQLQTTEEQLTGAQALLQYFFEENKREHANLVPMVIEIMWANFKVIKTLKLYIDDPVIFDNPDTGEKEYMISETVLFQLQALLLSRFFANKELNQLSYSVGLH